MGYEELEQSAQLAQPVEHVLIDDWCGAPAVHGWAADWALAVRCSAGRRRTQYSGVADWRVSVLPPTCMAGRRSKYWRKTMADRSLAPGLPRHEHGTVRVPDALVAHRPQHHLPEPTEAAAAHHQDPRIA